MALGVYVGAGSVKTVSDIYVGVNNTPRKVKEIYVGVNNTPRKCWPPYTDYGDNVNLFTYGNKTALYRSNAHASDSSHPENVANGTVLFDPYTSGNRYSVNYVNSGTCVYFTTKDKYDLQGYDYASITFDYSNLTNLPNASHRISIGTDIKVGPHTDSIARSTGSVDMDTLGDYLNILIDLRNITDNNKYYIKAGPYLDGDSGHVYVKCTRFQLHKSKPSNFTANYTLAPV